MNKVILIGNLTRTPEVKSTQSGLTVCTFTIAVNRRFKDADGNRQVDFIPVVAWRQLAELCAKYLDKGRKCAVMGQMQTRTYEAQDGARRYVTEVLADEVEFLSGGQQAQQAPAEAPQDRPKSDFKPQPTYAEGFGYGETVDDDELPF